MVSYLAIFILVMAGYAIWQWRRAAINKAAVIRKQLSQPFPANWRDILEQRVLFYAQLDEAPKTQFEKRVTTFLAYKTIRGVDIDINDTVRLLVAASAIIPTFAFPGYNYPQVKTILVYPKSFDERFQTDTYRGRTEFVTGMVGNRALNDTVLLSKPDLINDFNGKEHPYNVGIHEFVHLLDMADGAADGIPESLIQPSFVTPWRNAITQEIGKIKEGSSDINPYALKNNAEFLAVVSEYFFNNPDQLQKQHPGLYQHLAEMYHTEEVAVG